MKSTNKKWKGRGVPKNAFDLFPSVYRNKGPRYITMVVPENSTPQESTITLGATKKQGPITISKPDKKQKEAPTKPKEKEDKLKDDEDKKVPVDDKKEPSKEEKKPGRPPKKPDNE